jgi:hypothetical protein
VLAEQLLAGHQQARFLLDHVTDVIGQAAIGVGDIGATFHHQDLGLLVQPPQSRCA